MLWATKLSWRHICKNLIFLKVSAISFLACIKRPKGAKESSSSFNEFIITSKSPSRTIETTFNFLIKFKSSHGYHNFYFCNWIWKSNFLGHRGYKQPLLISNDYPNANLTLLSIGSSYGCMVGLWGVTLWNSKSVSCEN